MYNAYISPMNAYEISRLYILLLSLIKNIKKYTSYYSDVSKHRLNKLLNTVTSYIKYAEQTQ